MSWSSLFAFDNPNGEVGRQFTAIPNSSLIYATYLTGSQKMATFNNLPIGIYSVSVSITLANTSWYFGGITPIINSWILGASKNDGSITTSTFELGSVSAVGVPTTTRSNTTDTYSTMVVNFILNNTSGTSPIYINSVYDFPEGNNVFEFTAISSVATKIA